MADDPAAAEVSSSAPDVLLAPVLQNPNFGPRILYNKGKHGCDADHDSSSNDLTHLKIRRLKTKTPSAEIFAEFETEIRNILYGGTIRLALGKIVADSAYLCSWAFEQSSIRTRLTHNDPNQPDREQQLYSVASSPWIFVPIPTYQVFHFSTTADFKKIFKTGLTKNKYLSNIKYLAAAIAEKYLPHTCAFYFRLDKQSETNWSPYLRATLSCEVPACGLEMNLVIPWMPIDAHAPVPIFLFPLDQRRYGLVSKNYRYEDHCHHNLCQRLFHKLKTEPNCIKCVVEKHVSRAPLSLDITELLQNFSKFLPRLRPGTLASVFPINFTTILHYLHYRRLDRNDAPVQHMDKENIELEEKRMLLFLNGNTPPGLWSHGVISDIVPLSYMGDDDPNFGICLFQWKKPFPDDRLTAKTSLAIGKWCDQTLDQLKGLPAIHMAMAKPTGGPKNRLIYDVPAFRDIVSEADEVLATTGHYKAVQPTTNVRKPLPKSKYVRTVGALSAAYTRQTSSSGTEGSPEPSTSTMEPKGRGGTKSRNRHYGSFMTSSQDFTPSSAHPASLDTAIKSLQDSKSKTRGTQKPQTKAAPFEPYDEPPTQPRQRRARKRQPGPTADEIAVVPPHRHKRTKIAAGAPKTLAAEPSPLEPQDTEHLRETTSPSLVRRQRHKRAKGDLGAPRTAAGQTSPVDPHGSKDHTGPTSPRQQEPNDPGDLPATNNNDDVDASSDEEQAQQNRKVPLQPPIAPTMTTLRPTDLAAYIRPLAEAFFNLSALPVLTTYESLPYCCASALKRLAPRKESELYIPIAMASAMCESVARGTTVHDISSTWFDAGPSLKSNTCKTIDWSHLFQMNTSALLGANVAWDQWSVLVRSQPVISLTNLRSICIIAPQM